MITKLCSKCAKLLANKCFPFERQYLDNRRLIPLYLGLSSGFSTSRKHYDKNIGQKKYKFDMSKFPVERIRNFSIIAHIDHGKSTLADRLLEITGTISKSNKNKQVLDKLQVERERGITVKAQTASLFYQYDGETYLLNLIDTPGHVDFTYEVSRSLKACQGVILLVDANQGVQAQTLANFFMAFELDLTIIPVLNKIDLKGAQPEVVTTQLETLFDIEADQVLQVSAKLGTNVEDVLRAVIERMPPPDSNREKPLKALLFDSWFDKFRGAVVNVAVIDGQAQVGDRITSAHSGKSYEVNEIGILYPDQTPAKQLLAGQVGYIIAGMKETNEAQVGDTLYNTNHPVEALPGFKEVRPMVFAGIYPADQSEYSTVKRAIEKLTLNDPSVSVYPDSSAALGVGWRLGFLGLLHMDVFNQRLEQEHNAAAIVTSPNVPYRVTVKGSKNIKKYGGETTTILNPCHLPDRSIVVDYQEPMVMGTIIAPSIYIGSITTICLERRGVLKDQMSIDDTRVVFKVLLPLNEILVDFFDTLKSLTSGYASFDYEDYGYQSSELVKVNFALNGREVEELTQIAHVSRARDVGKKICAKLKEAIPQQLFEVIIQSRIGTKVISRETVKALRKDVLAKCYGGDITRKMKLLRRQTEGKKKMRSIGNIEVPKDAFISVLKQ